MIGRRRGGFSDADMLVLLRSTGRRCEQEGDERLALTCRVLAASMARKEAARLLRLADSLEVAP